jgi:hypothetical protein
MITGVVAGVGDVAAAEAPLAVAEGSDKRTAVGMAVGAGAAVQAARANANPRSKCLRSMAGGL